MRSKMKTLVLAGLLTCTLAIPVGATGYSQMDALDAAGQVQELPDSVLYYGTVQEIGKDENGTITRLYLESDRYGTYVMGISEETAWIDSGKQTASDPADLQIGERVYVFHSAISTYSLPPQSAAYAVVRNVPMDASCAHYHQVEDVSVKDGQIQITTDNGGLFLFLDENTTLSSYHPDQQASQDDIQVGVYIMAWYGAVAESYPAQTHASHVMVLSEQSDSTTLTRAELVLMLHEQAGKPIVNYAMAYTDVPSDADYAEAVRWATSEQLVSGYSDSTFGADDDVSREQLVTILWRYAGSPMLMDYTGLLQYEDVNELSPYAQPAFAWAHQKGYLNSMIQNNMLKPKDEVSLKLAQDMLKAIMGE